MEKGKRKILLVDGVDNGDDSLYSLLGKDGFDVVQVTDPDLVKDAALQEKARAVLINCDTFDARI